MYRRAWRSPVYRSKHVAHRYKQQTLLCMTYQCSDLLVLSKHFVMYSIKSEESVATRGSCKGHLFQRRQRGFKEIWFKLNDWVAFGCTRFWSPICRTVGRTFLSNDSLRQVHLISLAVGLWPPPDKQDALVNSIIRELIKKQCSLCFEESKVYTILFRKQNTRKINDFTKADEIKSYMSVHYQIWYHVLKRPIYSPILLLQHDLDDGTDRFSLNVDISLPIYAAYSRRREKV